MLLRIGEVRSSVGCSVGVSGEDLRENRGSLEPALRLERGATQPLGSVI